MKHVYRPGVVLHLDSEELARYGARCTDNSSVAVQGSHFFLCIEADSKEGAWTPLFSDPGVGRVLIESDQKKGHQKWTAGNSYYNPLQLWQAPHRAVQFAAKKGRDQSRGDAQNVVSSEAVPNKNAFAELPPAGAGSGGA